MRRKNNLHHRLWYAGRNRKRLYFRICIIIILAMITMFTTYIHRRTKISLEEFSEYRTKSIITGIVSSAVNNNFPDYINYEEIVIVKRDEFDRITSIQTNVGKLNRIFANLSSDIQRELSGLKEEKINIPLGTILGDSFFAANGPGISVKIIPAGSVETNFRSEFTSAGINQTRHRIYMEVKTEVGIVIPFMKKKSGITTNIPLSETVIVGEVPEYYMNSIK